MSMSHLLAGVAACACGLLAQGAAQAAEPDPSVLRPDISPGSQEKAHAVDQLTGDWGGLRTDLERRGVNIILGYKNETAGNVTGGTSRMATSVGQADLGVALDLHALMGWEGATIQSTITYRHGPSLNAQAGLNFLEEPQETFGRGQTWRWTELWLRQRLADDHVIIKVGRLAGGEFANWGCDFTNLGFCGSQVGTTNTYFWYNWPIAEWGGLLKVRNDRFFVHLGVNEDNTRNLDVNFFVAQFKGARGVVEHLEGGWTPAFGDGRLGGVYQAGVWHDTASHPDVLLDAAGAPAPLTGRPFAQIREQTGYYLNLEQQLSGEAHVDPVTGLLNPARGLTVGAFYERGDQRTATTRDEITVEALYTAPFAGRVHDRVGVALGRSTVTARQAEASALANPLLGPQRAEYRAEVFYRALLYRGVFLRPNLQYVADPGGYDRRRSALILGLRMDLNF